MVERALAELVVGTNTDLARFYLQYQGPFIGRRSTPDLDELVDVGSSIMSTLGYCNERCELGRQFVPLDPAISGRVNWDALADSLWSGLDGLAPGSIAIVWRGAERLQHAEPRAFAIASDILTSTAAQLTQGRDGARAGHEVRVLLKRAE